MTKSLGLLICWLVITPVTLLAQVTAIKAGKLVDPGTGATAANQIILIEGGKITAVGANLPIPAGATVMDLSAYTVLPGLFDAHTHLCMDMKPERESSSYITSLLESNSYRAIQSVANARAMLEAGFTTVRDVGNSGNYIDTDLRVAIERGVVPGPTIINAGRIIAPYGVPLVYGPDIIRAVNGKTRG
jgi:imidazolonepropionase-like amidohydrolase